MKAKVAKGVSKRGRDDGGGGASEPQAKRKHTEKKKTTGNKMIVLVLPGSSSELGKAAKDLIEALKNTGRYDVRVRPGSASGGTKWSGWNPLKNAEKVLGLCPHGEDAEPWCVLAWSFGCRVACSIVSEKLTPVPPRLIFMGYPMYGGGLKDKEARVEEIKKLPADAKVLAISGGKDEPFLTKNVPTGSPEGKELWDAVIKGMHCKPTLKMHPKGGHGVFESGKGSLVEARNEALTTSVVQWMHDFTASN